MYTGGNNIYVYNTLSLYLSQIIIFKMFHYIHISVPVINIKHKNYIISYYITFYLAAGRWPLVAAYWICILAVTSPTERPRATGPRSLSILGPAMIIIVIIVMRESSS